MALLSLWKASLWFKQDPTQTVAELPASLVITIFSPGRLGISLNEKIYQEYLGLYNMIGDGQERLYQATILASFVGVEI